MLGWLIVNGFLGSNKFNELYNYLQNSANEYGISLQIKSNDELVGELSSGFEKLPDFAIFWDKDVYLAKRLEESGVRLFNSATAVEICDNKILTALTLNNKVKTPKTIIAPKTFEGVNYSDKTFLKNATKELGFPLIIKEAYGSFGHQVYLANDYQSAEKIVDRLGHKDFLMQEFISSSYGKDVRVNVVGGKVVCAMLRYNENDFRSNISSGGKMKKITLNSKQEELAVKVCSIIGLDFAGVDILFGENDQPILCEVNSNPHFKSSLECTGVDMSKEIIKYIKGVLQ